MKLYIGVFLLFFTFTSFANESKELIKISDDVSQSVKNSEQEKKSSTSFQEDYDDIKNKIDEAFDRASKNQVVAKTGEILKYVFAGENAIFKDKNHLISMTYGGGITGNSGANLLFGSYSIPVNLFVNGRATAEVGGIIGSILGSNGQYGNITQVIGGAMYEIIINARYFYVTVGLGIYIRDVSNSTNFADRIGSQFVFGEKIAIGKTIFDRFTVEVMFRHFSNGGLTEVNNGYNFVGLGLGILI